MVWQPWADRIASRTAAALLSLLALAPAAKGHPLCFYGPDRAVSRTVEATFCPNDDPAGFCCEPNEEAALASRFAAKSAALTAECAFLYKQVICGVCSPYSAHLYTRLLTKGEDGLAMTKPFCDGFVLACGADLALPSNYCDEHVENNRDASKVEYWSYPLNIDTGFSESGLIPAFPNLPLERLPLEPVAMHMTPDGEAWWIAGMAGYIKTAASQDPRDATDVLDISDKVEYSYEQGLLDFAFSPSFSDTGLFYVSYTIPGEIHPENGRNVLSKFVYHPGDKNATTLSEEVLITTEEKSSSVHSSGWVGFAPSSYAFPEGGFHDLYWSIGDGGPQNDPFNRAQDLSNLLGTIVRVSVPADLEGTGYVAPSGNPFDGAGGERPEICAWGLRNPHRCAFDSLTDALYCGDVGQDHVEEVNLIECGNDYGWRVFEGSRCNDCFEGSNCAALDRADYVFPTFQYCHFGYDSSGEEYDACGDRTITGLSVVGGHVYRGSKYADVLGGHYIFADHSTGVLHHLAPAADGGWAGGMLVTSIPKIVGFAEDHDGELYMIGYQGNIHELPCGLLCESGDAASSCMPQSDNAPTFEEIGCFYDTSAMDLATAPVCDGTMNAEICASFCATVEGATHFGLEYQRECHCGGGRVADHAPYGDQLGGSDCNMPCSGYTTEICGGRDKMNVYTIAAVESTPANSFPENYLGCYGDRKGARALTLATTDSDTMTMEECEAFCTGAGGTIYAMQYGRECFCGDDETDFEVYGSDDTCDYPCIGAPSTYCGGYDAMSVYTMVPPAPTPAATPTTDAPTAHATPATPTPPPTVAGPTTPATSTTPPTASSTTPATPYTPGPTTPATPTAPPSVAGPASPAAPTVAPTVADTEADSSSSASVPASISSSGTTSGGEGTVAPHRHLGCYAESSGGRMLRGGFTSSAYMTPAKCSAFCSARWSNVFNLQFGIECWCGDVASIAAIVRADDSNCNYPCGGDPSARCGGYFYVDLYAIVGM